MFKTILLAGITRVTPGGCIGASGPATDRSDPGGRVRSVRVPTTLTGIDGQAGVLLLGLQSR